MHEICQSYLNRMCRWHTSFVEDETYLWLFIVIQLRWCIIVAFCGCTFILEYWRIGWSNRISIQSCYSSLCWVLWWEHSCRGCWVIGWFVSAFWNEGITYYCICEFMVFVWWTKWCLTLIIGAFTWWVRFWIYSVCRGGNMGQNVCNCCAMLAPLLEVL